MSKNLKINNLNDWLMKTLLPSQHFSKFIAAFFLIIGTTLSAQTPVITSVTPTIITMNSIMTIDGTNFTTSSIVTFGGIEGGYTVISRTTTKIVIQITANRSGNLIAYRGNNVSTTQSAPYVTPITFITPIIKSSANNVHSTGIITDYNGYWKSTAASGVQANQPNTRHNVLAFRYNNIWYSTGADDSILDAHGETYVPQTYRAYSTRGVVGKTHGELFLAMPDLEDGTAHTALGNPNSPNILGMTIFDVLIDGLNGLDIGTGVTNFNRNASISFFSDHAQSGGGAFYNDNIPEVLISQIAQPNGTDYYHFSDVNGNIVGHSVSLTMPGMPAIGTYRLDLFTFPGNTDFSTATPNGNRPVDQRTREIRLVGLSFNDFGITDANIAQIHSFDMLAGGGADVGFLAYNANSFQIKSPVITSTPNSVKICKLPYPNSVTFTVGAAIQGGGTGNLIYQWKRNNYDIPVNDPIATGSNTSSLTIQGPITAAQLATYRVEVSNEFGAIVASSAVLKEGGDLAVWDGSGWNRTPNSGTSLLFAADYNTATDLPAGDRLDGCDCSVQNNITVTIDSGDKMILQNHLKLDPAKAAWTEVVPAGVDEFGNPVPSYTINHPALAEGRLVVKDNGSLIQVSETASNVGRVEVERTSRNLHQWDYIYWSAPVSGFNLTGLSPYSTPIYAWNPTAINANSTYGNWVSASGVMTAGKGYIARVNSNADRTVTFTGEVHNGKYDINLTGATNADPDTNYWNLVGNPYPSSINALDFLNANLDIAGNVRLWSHNAPIGEYNPQDSPFYQDFPRNYGDQYITYNALGSVPAGFNGKIASGQGFFVQGTSTTGKVTFSNLFRYKETVPVYNNNQFYRQVNLNETQVQGAEKSVIWLSIFNPSNVSANMAVGYVDGATYGEDRLFDAIVDEEPFSIYSLVENKGAIIQGRPTPFQNSDQVGIGVSVPSNGVFKIGIDNLSGLFENEYQQILLEDRYLNVIHDLRTTPYSFETLSGNFSDRFILRYEQSALGTVENNNNATFAFIKNSKLEVQTNQEIASIQVIDLSGKLVHTYNVPNSTQQFTGEFNFANGFYLVNIHLKNNTVVTKKLAH